MVICTNLPPHKIHRPTVFFFFYKFIRPYSSEFVQFFTNLKPCNICTNYLEIGLVDFIQHIVRMFKY